MTIREATEADAGAIARVHVTAWQSAYRGIMPDEVLDTLDVAQRQTRLERHFAEEADVKPIFVAEDESGAIVGFARGGPPSEDSGDYDCELHAIYLLDSAQGKGFGRALMEAFMRRMVGQGQRSMMLAVLADNAEAHGFYAHMGGVVVAEGTHTVKNAVQETVLPTVIYGWSDLSQFVDRA
jgi:L-amino acid N-acyltransferase YncA